MKVKIIIIIVILIIIVLALALYIFIRQNTGVQDIASLLKLPIKEEQILKIKSRTEEDNSTTLTLYIDQYFSSEQLPQFDITLYESTKLYDELTTLMKENDMSVEEAEVKSKFVSCTVKRGIFSEVVIPISVYIITEKDKNTIIFTSIPNGVLLPIDYRP